MLTSSVPLLSGLLLPESILHAQWFGVLATFVAINTVMYGALALAKTLPKVYVADWIRSRKQRSQTRSIYPDGLQVPETPHIVSDRSA